MVYPIHQSQLGDTNELLEYTAAIGSLRQGTRDSMDIFEDPKLHRVMLVDTVQGEAYFRAENDSWYLIDQVRLVRQIERAQRNWSNTVSRPGKLDAGNLLIFARVSIGRELDPRVAKTLEHFLN